MRTIGDTCKDPQDGQVWICVGVATPPWPRHAACRQVAHWCAITPSGSTLASGEESVGYGPWWPSGHGSFLRAHAAGVYEAADKGVERVRQCVEDAHRQIEFLGGAGISTRALEGIAAELGRVGQRDDTPVTPLAGGRQ